MSPSSQKSLWQLCALLNELASAATTLSQEKIPVAFRVDFRSNPRGQLFGRFDFLNTAILDMASMAILQWNSDVPAKKFDTPYQVAIGFVSSRSGPGLLVKHVVWALEKIFDIVVNEDQYRASNFEVRLGPTTLGVGNVYPAEKHSAAVNVPDTRIGGLPEISIRDLMLKPTLTTYNDTALDTLLALPASWQGNTSSIQTLPLSHTPGTSTHLNAEGRVNLKFWYRHDGAVVDDAQVYNASLKLLVKAAESPNLHATIWPGLATYNDKDKFTYTIRPVSFGTRGDMTYLDTIFSMATIVGMMSKTGGPPGKFAELYGTIRAGETQIGAFCIDKGDKTGMDLHELCYRRDGESANDGDGVATA